MSVRVGNGGIIIRLRGRILTKGGGGTKNNVQTKRRQSHRYFFRESKKKKGIRRIRKGFCFAWLTSLL